MGAELPAEFCAQRNTFFTRRWRRSSQLDPRVEHRTPGPAPPADTRYHTLPLARNPLEG